MTPSPAQIRLLLRFLEAPELRYARRSLVEYHAEGQALIDLGFMEPAGYSQTIVADEDDDSAELPVELDYDRGGLGYFSPTRGWVSVDQAQLQTYQPDLRTIFRHLLGEELRADPQGLVDLHGALLFNLGTMRLTKNGPRTEVWFGRRVGEAPEFNSIEAVIRRRPTKNLRLLLTSTAHHLLSASTPLMTRVVPIADILASDGATIDYEVLKARFNGTTPPVSAPLHLSEDQRHLTVHGTVLTFKGPVIQRALGLLFDAYTQNKRLRADELLRNAGSQSKSLDQVFGNRWSEISPYLKARDGTWSFEV